MCRLGNKISLIPKDFKPIVWRFYTLRLKPRSVYHQENDRGAFVQRRSRFDSDYHNLRPTGRGTGTDPTCESFKLILHWYDKNLLIDNISITVKFITGEIQKCAKIKG